MQITGKHLVTLSHDNLRYYSEESRDVEVNELDCDIVVNEFE